MPDYSELVVLRHGESPYSNIEPDLTPEGQEQIVASALALSEHLQEFDSVVALSSPSTRALGSANLFLKTVGLQDLRVRKVGALANFGILDMEEFMRYMDAHSTSIYGELWLTDELLAHENPIVESRQNVERRARSFLARYATAIDRIAKERGIKICALVFTHFEIGNEFLKGALTPHEFPIKDEPILGYGEFVIIGLEDPQRGIFTIKARGKTRRARFDPGSGEFKHTKAKKK